MVTDPKNRANSRQILFNLPPIHELVDPSKFDIEIVNPGRPRVLRFTPLPGSTITRNGAQANNDQPVLVKEAILSLMGVTQEQMSVLFTRAAGEKRPDSTPKGPPEEVGPRLPESSPGDKTRP